MIGISQEHITVISPEYLDSLARYAAPNSVSIWMPTYRAGSQTQQNPIRMRNLLAQATEHLVKLGMRRPDAEKRIAVIRSEVDGDDFWRQRSGGLCVLLGNEDPLVLRLPVAAPEIATVCDHFYLKPMFGELQQDARFYILALSENSVRLLRASRFDVQPVDLPGAPATFAEFMQCDDPERHVGFHTGTAPHQPGGKRPAAYHGQGGGGGDEEWIKKRLADYCRKIDESVQRIVHGEPGPLLLAATEPLHGVYRQTTTCAQIDQRCVGGNPDETPDGTLHHKALEMLHLDFEHPLHAAVRRYEKACEANMGSCNLKEILRAASINAVDTLVVRLDEQQWGRFDMAQGVMEQHSSQQPGDAELLDLAARLAYRGGASVHAVATEGAPIDSAAVAVLRFRVDT